MARRKPTVTWQSVEPHQMPALCAEAVALLLDLQARGLLAQLAHRLRLNRPGYAGIDVAVCLLYFFASPSRQAPSTLWPALRPYRHALAALAGRSCLMTPSSLSRALQRAETQLIRPACAWMLSEGCGLDALLQHPAMKTYDATGSPWHLFDADGTMTVLRWRALPQGQDLPLPQRRSAAMKPGHRGRKRGDVQVCRVTLQHAGSAAFLYQTLEAGNGQVHDQLDAVLQVLVHTCQRLQWPLSHALLRLDGLYGWVPYYWACRDKGIAFLTRLNRYELLEQDDVCRALREGEWQMVPDSRSGPQRGALELGVITIPAGEETRRPDGGRYEPLSVRVVVSRLPHQEPASRGVVREGWQYELFAADVPVEAFSAADVVASYLGRAGHENRLAQEDRELGLDHLFSYHLPGQELASMLGLWVWNLRLVRGLSIAPLPEHPPVQPPRSVVVDPRSNPSLPRASPPEALPTQPPGSPPAPAAAEGSPAPSVEAQQAHARLVALLGELPWEQLLRKRPTFRFDAPTGTLVCRSERRLLLSTVCCQQSVGRPVLLFRLAVGGCVDCTVRAGCNRSPLPRASMKAKFSIPASQAQPLADALRQWRGAPVSLQATQAATKRRQPPPSDWPRTASTAETGPLAIVHSLFQPAKARRLWQQALYGLTVRVVCSPAPSVPAGPELLAVDEADRQRRRKSWDERLARYQLHPEVNVQIDIRGSPTIRHLLQPYLQQDVA